MEVSPWISPRALNYGIGRGIIQPPHPIHAPPPTCEDKTAKPGPFGLGITNSPPFLGLIHAKWEVNDIDAASSKALKIKNTKFFHFFENLRLKIKLSEIQNQKLPASLILEFNLKKNGKSNGLGTLIGGKIFNNINSYH